MGAPAYGSNHVLNTLMDSGFKWVLSPLKRQQRCSCGGGLAHGGSPHLFAIAEDKLKLPEDVLDAGTHLCVKPRVIQWPAGSAFVIQSLCTFTP